MRIATEDTEGTERIGVRMDVSWSGNLVEAGLWFLVAASLAIASRWSAGHRRRIQLVLAGAFVLFGISDVIESKTGAWWRPPWLLILKAACVAVILWGIVSLLRTSRSVGD